MTKSNQILRPINSILAKFFLFFTLLFFQYTAHSQWTELNIPTTSTNRFDDIYFINDSIGWAAGGETGTIYFTNNGGANWTKQFEDTSHYLRSIEFATPSLGFCGSLDSTLFRTTDSGKTWVNITSIINPRPKGVCGLAAASPLVIYGCGKWTSPAFVIKSVDGGNSWTIIDLSIYASALVDIHFKDEMEGFAVGKANPETDGGIILHTIDGGNSWLPIYKTDFNDDVVWKIQTPDGINFYGSIESQPASNNVRYLYSTNGGMSWKMDTVINAYNYMQMIGFLDSLNGWMGGASLLLETKNGGESWDTVTFSGNRYNRFFKMNDSTAFLTGNKVYKYDKESISTGQKNESNTIHALKAFPNPTNSKTQISISVHHRTYAQLELYTENGRRIKSLYDGHINPGETSFQTDLSMYPNQLFFVILKTNEEMLFSRILKK